MLLWYSFEPREDTEKISGCSWLFVTLCCKNLKYTFHENKRTPLVSSYLKTLIISHQFWNIKVLKHMCQTQGLGAFYVAPHDSRGMYNQNLQDHSWVFKYYQIKSVLYPNTSKLHQSIPPGFFLPKFNQNQQTLHFFTSLLQIFCKNGQHCLTSHQQLYARK